MSSWGNLDNLLAKGNVTTTNTSDLVTGFGGTEFLSNVVSGDYVTIASNKYQVQNVVSNTQLYLTNISATTSANVKMYIQEGPKYIANVSFPANNYSIQNIYGIDRNEMMNVRANANATHTGWTHFQTYVDAYGAVRIKSESLVAMSKNFNANATSDLQTDASDNTIFPQ